MDKVMEMLEQLASELGVAVEYLWGVLIKQAYINGIIMLVFAAVSFIGIMVVIYEALKLYKYFDENYKALAEDRRKNGTGYAGSFRTSSYEEDKARESRNNVTWIGVTIGVCLLIIFIPCIISGFQHWYNPDYYALKTILTSIGGV